MRALVDPRMLGPQVGAGMLSVTFPDRSVAIDLNPGWVDNNVTLLGVLVREHAGC